MTPAPPPGHAQTGASTSATPRRRSWWGLRERPGRLALAVFRMPLRIYQKHPERLPDGVFLRLVHVGRRSGMPHEAVTMVLRYDPHTREAVSCAAWGTQTDWLRNLRAAPAISVQVGRDSFTPQHRFLSEQEAFDVAAQFQRAHPARFRLIGAILGWGSLRNEQALRQFVRTHPFVAFRPADPSTG